MNFCLMHEHIALVKALDVKVDFGRCHSDSVLWKPLVHFLVAANPHEYFKLSKEASAIVARMIA